MKNFLYKIITKQKEEIKNPNGEVVENICAQLKISQALKVNSGKFYEIKILEENKEKADKKIKQISEEILTNPLVETYEITDFKEIKWKQG